LECVRGPSPLQVPKGLPPYTRGDTSFPLPASGSLSPRRSPPATPTEDLSFSFFSVSRQHFTPPPPPPTIVRVPPEHSFFLPKGKKGARDLSSFFSPLVYEVETVPLPPLSLTFVVFERDFFSQMEKKKQSVYLPPFYDWMVTFSSYFRWGIPSVFFMLCPTVYPFPPPTTIQRLSFFWGWAALFVRVPLPPRDTFFPFSLRQTPGESAPLFLLEAELHLDTPFLPPFPGCMRTLSKLFPL